MHRMGRLADRLTGPVSQVVMHAPGNAGRSHTATRVRGGPLTSRPHLNARITAAAAIALAAVGCSTRYPAPRSRLVTTVVLYELGSLAGPRVPLVRVRVGKAADRLLLLDTGARYTILSATCAHAAGIGHRDGMSVRAVAVPGHISQIQISQIQMLGELAIGSVVFHDLPVAVHPDAVLARMLSFPIDGVLGMDVIRKCAVRLQPQRRRITLWYPGGLATTDLTLAGLDGPAALPVRSDSFGRPWAEVGFGALSPRSVLLDTGSETSQVQSAVARELGLHPAAMARVGCLCGTRPQALSGPVRAAVCGQAFKVRLRWSVRDDPAAINSLGGDVLSDCDFLLDVGAGRAYLARCDGSGGPFPSGGVAYSLPLSSAGDRSAPILRVWSEPAGVCRLLLAPEYPVSEIWSDWARRLPRPRGPIQSHEAIQLKGGLPLMPGAARQMTDVTFRITDHPGWPLTADAAHDTDGLLGSDVLGRFRIGLDLLEGVIYFSDADPGPGPLTAAGWQLAALDLHPGRISLQASVDDVPETFDLTVADGVSVLLGRTLAVRPVGTIHVPDLGLTECRFHTVSVGSAVWRRPVLGLVRSNMAPRGILGRDFASKVLMLLDLRQRRALLRSNPEYHLNPHDWVGFGATIHRGRNGAWLVGSVIQPSPAWAAGVRSGDELLGVDGTPVGSIPAERLRHLAKGIRGAAVMLRLRGLRGDRVLDVRLSEAVLL